MEVIAYGILSFVWWIASCTFLLPLVLLLKCNKTARNKWFSWLYTKVIVWFGGKGMQSLRQKLFRNLEDELEKQGRPQKLRILEIGVGSGANLRFYPENSLLIAVDMNPEFEKFFQESKKQHPQVKLERTIHGMAEDMNSVESDSIDVVVSMYVLCSVEDVDKVIKEVHRVLKPGGCFVFMEHVAFEKHRWISTLQNMVTPLCNIYFDGCSLNRDIETNIRKVRFCRVSCKYLECLSYPLYVRNHLMGLAVK